MKPPFQVASFEGYRSAVVDTLVPRITGDVRGVEVRLSARRRHIDVVVFRVGDDTRADILQLALYEAASPLASQFDDFADYTMDVVVEVCGEATPLIYRGVPMWERPGTRWQLAAEPREPGLLVQAG